MKQFTVAEDGFHGFLHLPERDLYPGKAVIVAGGNEGVDHIPMSIGRRFAENGMTALGVCFWNAPGLPEELVEVPVESIENAAGCLKARGYQKIAVYGISKGGELALLSASLIPDITCAVALCPQRAVMPGIAGKRSMASSNLVNRSGFTWRGKPLPFVPCKPRAANALQNYVMTRQTDIRYVYEKLLYRIPEKAVIRAEHIHGPLLLISPERDPIWPSDTACRDIEKRLQAQGHPYPVKRLEYRYASHILAPISTPMLRFFQVERDHPQECAQSREDAFKQTLDFLREW